MKGLGRLAGLAVLLTLVVPVLASSQGLTTKLNTGRSYTKGSTDQDGLRFFECAWIDWWSVSDCGNNAYMERYGASPQMPVPVDAVGDEKNLVDAGELGTVQVDDEGRSMPMLDELAESRRVRVQQYWRLNNLPSVRSQAPPRESEQ